MNSVKKYLAEIGGFETLSAEEEIELGRIMKSGDKGEAAVAKKAAAREKLINHNLRYVVHVIKKDFPEAIKDEDLFMEMVGCGNVGLIAAVDGFDYEKGRFTTYADYWIKRKIYEGVAKYQNLISKPENAVKGILVVGDTAARLEQILGRTPSEEEIWEALDGKMSREKVAEMIYLSRESITSLDNVHEDKDGDAMSYEEVISDGREDALDVVVREDRDRAVKDALAELSDVERRVIELRFGFDKNYGELTFDGIAAVLFKEGLSSGEKVYSKQNVHLIMMKAIEKLRGNQKFIETITAAGGV